MEINLSSLFSTWVKVLIKMLSWSSFQVEFRPKGIKMMTDPEHKWNMSPIMDMNSLFKVTTIDVKSKIVY